MPVSIEPAEDGDRVVVATLDNGKVNAFDSPLIADLIAAVGTLNDTQALVLTGRPGMFSGGLDLGVLAAGGTEADSLLADMGRLLFSVLESPRPVVVAADGHGIAAGAMLMLVADLTFVSDRSASYGFAEVPNGMPLPAAVVELIGARANSVATMRLAAQGELVGPDGAVELGLADEVVSSDSLVETAMARAALLAELPAEPYSATKALVNRELLERMRSVS